MLDDDAAEQRESADAVAAVTPSADGSRSLTAAFEVPAPTGSGRVDRATGSASTVRAASTAAAAGASQAPGGVTREHDDRPSAERIAVAGANMRVATCRDRACRQSAATVLAVERRQRERDSSLWALSSSSSVSPTIGSPRSFDFVDHVAGQPHAEAADEAGVPGLVGHLAAVGVEPGDVLDVGAADAAALEELAPAEHRLLAARSDEPAGELEELAAARRVRSQSSQVSSLSWQ